MMLKCISDHLISRKIFNEAVEHDPMILKIMTQEMCNRAAEKIYYIIQYVPDQYKTGQFCKNVFLNPITLKVITDPFQTQQIGGKALNRFSFILECCLDRYNNLQHVLDGYLCSPIIIKYVPD